MITKIYITGHEDKECFEVGKDGVVAIQYTDKSPDGWDKVQVRFINGSNITMSSRLLSIVEKN